MKYKKRNALFEQIAKILNMEAKTQFQMRKNRIKIFKTMKFFECDFQELKKLEQFVKKVEKDGLTQWSQFSPWLNGDPSWKAQ